MVEIEKEYIRKETGKAYLVEVDKNTQFWFPKSQVFMNESVLEIPDWLYDQKVDELLSETQ